MINKEHYQIIRQHPAFAHFPVEIFDKIAIEIQFRKIPKGQIIFFSGDRRDRLFLLHRGYVRIEQYDSTDTFSYMDYIKMNSVFPYGGMFFDERYHYTASAVTNVEYFSIPMDLFEDYSKKNVDQLLFITKRLSQILEFQELRLRNVVSAKLGATTRETVNQVLKKLREEGVIDYEHKKLTFKNKDYFMRYFEGS